jgi:hypothetical protein
MSNATKSRKSSRFQSYSDLIPHTEKPLASRRELAIGRNGAHVKPRKFHLSADEIKSLKAQYAETGIFPNPHNKGFYFYLIAALVSLGINEAHTQSKVMAKVEKLMSADDTIQGEGRDATTAWERFTSKDPRNKETGKDFEGRFDQNVTVLQRLTGLTPYGLKLLQVGQKVLGTAGAVIDVLVSDRGTRSLRLNTKSDRPINEGKVRGAGSPAELEAEKEARKAKAKRKAKKAKAAPATEAKADAPAAAAEPVTA